MNATVVKRPDKLKEDRKALSPPVIQEPLYQCAVSVTVTSYEPNATIDVDVNGTVISAPGGFPFPNGVTIGLTAALVAGQQVKARQHINAATVLGGGSNSQPFFQKFGMRNAIVNDYFPTDSFYDSLQVKFDRRLARGFMLTTAYTYGKAINYDFFYNAFPQLNRARSSDNPTHIFVQSYIYEMPFGKGKRWLQSGAGRWALGGWQVSGLLSMQTGAPLNFSYSSATLNAPGNGNRPNVVGKPEIYGNVGRGELWFDISKFSAPAPAAIGNTGRNILTGPGLVNVDLSLFRRFRILERATAEFRAESFNFTNTPHFLNPNTTFGNANFGQVTTATQDQRLVQLGLKVTF